MYRDVDIPVPDLTAADVAGQPAALHSLRRTMETGNFDSIAWRGDASKEDLLRLRRHYAANVTMLDDKIGELMDLLERRGYLDNSIVIFTSDHGDNLGDHGHVQEHNKYEGAVHVPLIVRAPNLGVPRGRVAETLVHWMDIAPTVLEAAGVAVPKSWEAKSLWPMLNEKPGGGDGAGDPDVEREAVYSELGRDHIQCVTELMIMRRDRRWKLVFHLGQDDGELYDLANDPGEVANLWGSADHRAQRDELIDKLLRWYMVSDQ